VDNLKSKTPKKDLVKLLAQKFDCTARTIEDRINDMLKGTGLNTLGYRLVKEKIGKEMYFQLNRVIPKPTQEDIF